MESNITFETNEEDFSLNPETFPMPEPAIDDAVRFSPVSDEPLEFQLPPEISVKFKKLKKLISEYCDKQDDEAKMRLVYYIFDFTQDNPDLAPVVLEFLDGNLHLGKEIKFSEISKELLRLEYKNKSRVPEVSEIAGMVQTKVKDALNKLTKYF
jgi:hypothetical protein